MTTTLMQASASTVGAVALFALICGLIAMALYGILWLVSIRD
jgi:hypothetical protein